MIRMELYGMEGALRRVRRLKLSPRDRRNLVGRMGNKVVSATRSRIRAKQTLDGAPMAPKAGGRKERRWRGISRNLVVQRRSADVAVVTLKNPVAARAALELQEGATQRMQAPKGGANAAAKERPCSKRQALTIKSLNKGFARMSIKAIRAKYSEARAGRVIRELRDVAAQQAWEVKLPARPFFGTNAQDRTALLGILQDTVRQNLAR